MARNKTRSAARNKRHLRLRTRVAGTPEQPRLNVFRSLSEIYAQIIDDSQGFTLVSASSIDQELKQAMAGLKKSDQAKKVGQALAERAKVKGIKKVVFDRGGYRYIGRVRALADSARESGLEF